MRIAQNFFFLIILLLSSCASIVSPSGGEKDVTSPTLLKAIPKEFSKNVNVSEFTLIFDELIKIDEDKNQFIISPIIENEPKINIKKKKITILLKDTLQPNTTYSFNFGSSIKDTREGNALNNFNYVFSTGNELDSMKLAGNVIDVLSGNPIPKTKVLLYDNLSDSAIYNLKPLAYLNTGEDGSFEFQNLKNKTYRIIALLETDNNLKYNSGNEKIGFLSYDIILDSIKNGIVLNLFQERGTVLKLIEKKYSNSKLLLKFNNPVKNLKLEYPNLSIDSIGKSFDFNTENDSVVVNFDEEIIDSLRVIVSAEGMINDTVFLRIQNKKIIKKSSISFKSNLINGNLIKPNEPLILELSKAYETSNYELIKLIEDSTEIIKYIIEDIGEERKKVQINYSWKEKTNYTLIIDKGTFINKIENDSSLFKFRLANETDFGNLSIKLKKSDSLQYIVQLKNEKNVVLNQVVINSDTTLAFMTLAPGLYKLSTVKDENRNGIWDTGNYMKKRQPEEILYYKGEIKLRANWDLDINYILN